MKFFDVRRNWFNKFTQLILYSMILNSIANWIAPWVAIGVFVLMVVNDVIIILKEGRRINRDYREDSNVRSLF